MINWSKVQRAADKAADKESANAQRRLDEIDRLSIRALRAVAAGVATAADTAKLAALEAEAAGLRGKVKPKQGQ